MQNHDQRDIRSSESVERDMVAVRIGSDMRTVVVGTPGGRVLTRTLNPKPIILTSADESACIRFILSVMFLTPTNLTFAKAVADRIEDRLMEEIRATMTSVGAR